MKENQQEAPQMTSETFTGKTVDYAKANKFEPLEDAESRQPATKNDKGGM